MTKKNKLSSQKRLAIAGFFAIFIALLFMISSVPATAGTGHQQETGFTTSVNYIPNPVLTANATWNTFYHNWKPLEYNNSKKNETLNAQLSTSFANPLNVNESDISTSALHQPLYGKTYFNNTSNWHTDDAVLGVTFNGATPSITSGNNNGMTSISILGNSSKAGKTGLEEYYIEFPLSNLPSTNLNYNYLTITGYNHIQKNVAGYSWEIRILNNSVDGRTLEAKNGTTRGTNNPTTSVNEPFFYSFPVTLMGEKNLTKASDIIISIDNEFNSAVATNDIASITITGMSLTESPYNLGASSQTTTLNGTTGNAKLKVLNPNFSWTEITNNGYTASLSQSMQNETESHTSINSGNFIEEATFQGNFQLPTAPDLTYSNSYISMNMTTPGSQFQVANLNGISYLSTIQTKNNGTYTFTTVNPNNANTIILEEKFTAAQWNASTNAPSIFTLAGIEYYWWVGLIGLMSVIGLGAAASSHFSGDEENLKIPKGKFGR